MTTSEPRTTAEAVEELRTIAHGWADGRRGDTTELIHAADRALWAGVDAPSLAPLAGLLTVERDLAAELFAQVTDELGFGLPPADGGPDGLPLARWWAAEIVAGRLDPGEGAALIMDEIVEVHGAHEALTPMIDAVRALWSPSPPGPSPTEITTRLTRAARELLTRIPDPRRSRP
ncbi:hypothetical protein [Streptomyces sp. NRRL B-24484]|uniref:hypothetical protein n=1 Tax=Streptomyces sp. NRRL B-24484 TaxID=1463833 RepID=UPI0006936510|nr:hypothetical protein [Streptomyces sp. NRRL B-24484]